MAVSYIGLELGSNSTWIYKLGNGVVLKEPSVIAMSNDLKNKEVRAVGTDAKNLIGRTSNNTSIFFPISNGVVQYEEYAVLMLKNFLNRIFTTKSFSHKIKAILCVPLGITTEEKKQFEIVCFKAGITEVYIVPEVIAYALANGLDIKSKTAQLMVGIGADVTNISIISNYSIVAGYNVSIGGSLVSLGIIKHIEDKFFVTISEEQAEILKTEICSLYDNYNARMPIVGINKLSGIKEQVMIEASELYAVVCYYYIKIAEVIKSIIASSRPEVVSDVLKQGIIFYGGSSNIVGFEQFMHKKLGIRVKILENSKPEIFGTEELIKNPEKLKKILKNNNLN